MHDLVIACGVEHMGHIPISAQERWSSSTASPYTQELLDRYDFVPQGISAELIAERWEISREEMDALAVESHRRAAAHRADFATRWSRSRRRTGSSPVTRASARTRTSTRSAKLKTPFKAGRTRHRRHLVAALRRRRRRARRLAAEGRERWA